MRYCFECVFFHVSTFWAGTDVTPGDSWEMMCSKDVWKFDPYKCNKVQYQQIMLTAETCQHYVPDAFVTERKK